MSLNSANSKGSVTQMWLHLSLLFTDLMNLLKISKKTYVPYPVAHSNDGVDPEGCKVKCKRMKKQLLPKTALFQQVDCPSQLDDLGKNCNKLKHTSRKKIHSRADNINYTHLRQKSLSKSERGEGKDQSWHKQEVWVFYKGHIMFFGCYFYSDVTHTFIKKSKRIWMFVLVLVLKNVCEVNDYQCFLIDWYRSNIVDLNVHCPSITAYDQLHKPCFHPLCFNPFCVVATEIAGWKCQDVQKC